MLTLFGALACAELASAFPRTGGVYVFLKETYSPVAGFLWGWAMFWVMHSGIIAAMATVFGRYAGFFVPLGDRGIRAVAVSAHPRHLGAQLRRREARQQRCRRRSRSRKVVAVVARRRRSASRWDRGLPDHISARRDGSMTSGPTRTASCWRSSPACFAFGGWHVVTYTAEETVQPERTIPRALALGIVDRDDVLRGAERRVFLRAAAGSRPEIHTRRGGRRPRRCSARRAARRSRGW